MDAFYASVEQRDHPEYRGKPIAVGNPEKRGVVATASYEARRYGIHSAMSSMKAKQLCPDLIFVNSHIEYYKSISHQIHAIFHEYTDIIEPLSLDEAFLDVTENKKNIPLAVDIAKEIKQKIKEQLGLIASAGVSYNKFLAKIASDYKKPDGLYTIHPDRAIDFISKLPIETFWGIGKVTARKMHQLGVHTGADLKKCSLPFLTRNFGKAGSLYYDFARGIDPRSVSPERIRKSVGCENTFEKDLTNYIAVVIELNHITAELIQRLEKAKFKGHTLTLKVKFHDFTQKTRCVTMAHELYTKQEILPLAKKLFQDLKLSQFEIRLIGLSVSNHFEETESHDPLQLTINFD